LHLKEIQFKDLDVNPFVFLAFAGLNENQLQTSGAATFHFT